ncbi:hypothetical protein UFOVP1382_137 [uncultured Caudovirales phage]|uniref:Uncharacterized protein n=1 Tax=uncultured Caudovirales phage TaxID=2100421 RepID=A0A6J5RXP4_9CAUD|nr:hypothetical protein UFOVP1382_137 [uncultured Caudovirales phage]
MTVRHSNANLAALLSEEKPYRPSILSAILARVGDDLTTAEVDVVYAIESAPRLLRRMLPADAVVVSGLVETDIGSITVPAGVLLANDSIDIVIDGKLNTNDGSADHTIRVYVANGPGVDPCIEIAKTPATSAGARSVARVALVAGTPFGPMDGPDTAAGYGNMISDVGAPVFTGFTPASVDLSLPITVRITAQVSLDDGSTVETFGYSISYQRAAQHPDAVE